MPEKKHPFLYFFAWLIIGLFLGGLILLYRGDIRIDIGQTVTDPTAEVTAGHKHRSAYTSFADAVMKAAPAVVSIKAIHWKQPRTNNTTQEIIQRFLGKPSPHQLKRQPEISSGSGVIIKPDGYILTNYHVIANSDTVHVRLNDGREVEASLIGSDPDTDLAVLKVDAGNLPTLKIADINSIHVGDIVLAIGDPFTIGQTVTQGIISATGRNQVSINTYASLIQTDAAVNPGNSGGALINTDGELIGINSSILSNTGSYQGISFAIPIDLAQYIASQIISKGYVVRGWLGAEGQELTPEILRTIELDAVHGILVTSVDKDGPGDRAGLQPGDIITRINGQDIYSTRDILNLIAAGKPGDVFEVEGIRARQSFKLKVVLGQRPLRSSE